MRPIRLASLVVIAVAAAACSTGASTPTFSPGAPSTPAEVVASAAPASAAPSAATRIQVSLSDTLKIEPAMMTVPAGTPVTFVITNTGTVFHEFTLGDEADQQAHDKEMMEAGGMSMPKDEPNAVGVEPGQTKEFTYTFETTGMTLAGCHVIGHYQGGMKAQITIQ
ncbi:MAG: copper-binding protein [Candidatus Limnocylindrales bacterium]